MATKDEIDRIVAERTLALVGVSRSGRKFGNAVLKELTGKGYTVYPVHPTAESVDGHQAYRSFRDTPTKPGAVIVVVPPSQAEHVVREAHAAGITQVWLQQGAGSPDARRFCREHDMTVVDGECILMFTDPTVWYHRAHRWARKVTGTLPR